VCRDLVVRLAHSGLIHCDFNEFNLLVSKDGDVTLIDFPQVPTIIEIDICRHR
jgi:RIO kinase 2